MRKLTILTSILALAACSSGGGGGTGGGYTHSASGTPTPSTFVPVPSINETETVNPSNTGVTGMTSSTVTNEAEVRSATVDYVATKMPDIYTIENLNSLNSGRGASNRSRSGELTDEQKFFIANTKINAMKTTLTEMADADDRGAYIAAHETAVAEALLLFGEDIDLENIDPETLLTDFNTIVDGTTIAAAINTFENENNMVYDRAMLDTVRFQDAGDANAYFKFHLTNNVIDQVAMFEGEGPNDYGWFTKTADPAGNIFEKTLYSYKFAMGTLPTSGEFTEEQLAAFAWFNGVDGKDDIVNLIFRSDKGNTGDGALTNLEKKNAMKTQINKEFDDFKNGQHDNTHNDEIELARTQYLKMIDDAFDALGTGWETGVNNVLGQTTNDLQLTATMNGVGKDLGLKYSDLGYADLKDVHEKADGSTKVEHTYAPYAGGYTDRIVDPGNNTATYTGTAVVGVDLTTKDVNGDTDRDGMLLTNTGATLRYDGSTHKSLLTMNNLRNADNEKWYNVTVEGDFSGSAADSNLKFTFNGTGKTTDEAFDFISNPTEVAFADTDWQETNQMFKQINADDSTIDYRGSADANYYGPVDTPTEAGATFHFSEEQHYVPSGESNEVHHEIGMYGAFGGKK